ncbi:MAG: ATP-binding cassette domain-containing protein, partial [Bacteroidetes bacterium]|nr:ATP-binding cassette domain-containing protein [Bacteroidota bacterium]
MIEIKELSKVFHKGQEKVVALQKVSLHISENTFTVIKGPSGSGKSSLLFSIGGMLRPTSGDVFLNGENLYQLTEASRRRKAAIAMGFVYQSYHLLPYLTVTENILLQKRLPFLNIDR